jgi:hypothetical protein
LKTLRDGPEQEYASSTAIHPAKIKRLFHEVFNAMSISLPTENWGQDRGSAQARFDLDSDFWIIAPFRRPPGSLVSAPLAWPRHPSPFGRHKIASRPPDGRLDYFR